MDLPEQIKSLERLYDNQNSQIRTLRKSGLGSVGHSGVRWICGVPFVTDDCAKALTSVFVMDCNRLENAMARMY